jgi:hypothetical protein
MFTVGVVTHLLTKINGLVDEEREFNKAAGEFEGYVVGSLASCALIQFRLAKSLPRPMLVSELGACQ